MKTTTNQKMYTKEEVAELIAMVMQPYMAPVYLTPAQVAESLHLTADYVRELAKRKILKGYRAGDRWLFTPNAVREYAESSVGNT